jgi:polysaccharide export outer membrane protein
MRKMTMVMRALGALTASMMVYSAVQAQTVPEPSVPTMQASDGYQLGINDEIEITVFGQGQQSQVTKTRIKEDGTVTLPLIGAVTARDLTARQLASRITEQLRSGGFFTKPVVNVDVAEYVSNAVTIFGSVAQPGVFPLDRAQTVAMMVARAGGVRSDGADYVVLRRRGDSTEHQILLTSFQGNWSTSTQLRAGDALFAPAAPIIYIYGQVNSPGSFPIRSGMTVRQVLAKAGGPTLAGSERKISIYRGEIKLDRVDLNSAAQEGDIFYVKERLF